LALLAGHSAGTGIEARKTSTAQLAQAGPGQGVPRDGYVAHSLIRGECGIDLCDRIAHGLEHIGAASRSIIATSGKARQTTALLQDESEACRRNAAQRFRIHVLAPGVTSISSRDREKRRRVSR
jgi:hypothetical protein